MQRTIGRQAVIGILALATLVGTGAWAQTETFEVISVNNTGCNSGEFAMTVERANLDGGTYTVHTVVTVGDLIYMNEAASISINGQSGWNVFDNFTYGPVPNPGTYPIPAGQQMRLDFFLERPIGSVLYDWLLVVDGCDSGNIIYNGRPDGFVQSPLQIPTLSSLGIALLALALAGLAVTLLRRRAA